MKTNDQIPFDQAFLEELMIPVSGGRIELRDDRIKEKWAVDLPAYSLAKFPVTQAMYQALMGENPSAEQGAQLPVETVSWQDAAGFCNRLSQLCGYEACYVPDPNSSEMTFEAAANGFRLPTEAEWQFACQAGTSAIRYGELTEIAWYKDNAGGCLHEVGGKAPNPWGFYDMLGNVWEWCTDIYDETVYGSYRIFRGGGWSDEARSVMATTRRRSHPVAFKIDDLGFRIARNQ